MITTYRFVKTFYFDKISLFWYNKFANYDSFTFIMCFIPHFIKSSNSTFCFILKPLQKKSSNSWGFRCYAPTRFKSCLTVKLWSVYTQCVFRDRKCTCIITKLILFKSNLIVPLWSVTECVFRELEKYIFARNEKLNVNI